MNEAIEWADEDIEAPTNSKYPAILTRIKRAQLTTPAKRNTYARVASFSSEGTARDLVNRLGKSNDEFNFISRKTGETTTVYAVLKAGVSE